MPAPALWVVAQGPIDAIHPLGGRTFVTTSRYSAWVDGDDLVFDRSAPAAGAGLPAGEVRAMDGDWPGAAWEVREELAAQGGASTLLRWKDARWTEVQKSTSGMLYLGTSPWIGGVRLALASRVEVGILKFEVVDGDAKVPLPVKSKERSKSPGSAQCDAPIFGESFLAFPSGEIFVAGATCDGPQDYGDAAVLEWRTPGAPPVLTTLTKGALHFGFRIRRKALGQVTVFGASAGDVYVAAANYLGHFDGSAWARCPARSPRVRLPPRSPASPTGPSGLRWPARARCASEGAPRARARSTTTLPSRSPTRRPT